MTSARAGAEMVLGYRDDSHPFRVATELAVLVIGPPRSGKTSCVVVPAVADARGPVVSTSTKADVLQATIDARRQGGRVWLFDPAGTERCPPGVDQLRWSPITGAATWDGALLMAQAMVEGSRSTQGATNEGFWRQRAQTLLAPLLFAAARDGLGIDEVVKWAGGDLKAPSQLLDCDDRTAKARQALLSLANSDPRERASVFSFVDGVLSAYHSDAASAAALNPNFDARGFVTSAGDSVFITAAAHQQQLVAPLVVGLLHEIRLATFAAHRLGRRPQVLFALDEVANIAPIHDLPGLVSEAGGQGLQVLACVQDLSQVRGRWGAEIAHGFLTLFGIKLILPGVMDQQTLYALSTAAGDIQDETQTATSNRTAHGEARSQSWQMQWRPRYPAGTIACLPAGRALAFEGARPSVIELRPWWQRRM
ncbi:type IV secretory system conjugative DNA transfer family protein [Nocardia sp. NPDC050412]|uniref:type IV secretory system conjugative DNA transfer family protein n=1 Tax=Nocardia sp. NPDC050412 TaxID=3364320 RepID=UPI0037AF35F6